MKKEEKKDPPKVDYGDATPEDVAKALLKFRPKKEKPGRGRRDSNPQRQVR